MGARAGREKQGESRDRGGVAHEIKVSVTDKGHTSVIVDGVELNMLAEGFTLSQNAGEIPVLTLRVPIIDGADIELPDGIVIANIEKPEE